MANGILVAQPVIAQKVNLTKKTPWSDSIPHHWTHAGVTAESITIKAIISVIYGCFGRHECPLCLPACMVSYYLYLVSYACYLVSY